ncbi:MAG: hypothetical protein ABJA60_02495 [Nitrosospira sp.]
MGFNSLLLCVYNKKKKLCYVGHVEKGFSDETLLDLADKLERMESIDNPFTKSFDIVRDVHWVKPMLVVEIFFDKWLSRGNISGAVSHGLNIHNKPEKIYRNAVKETLMPKQKSLRTIWLQNK